jgi:hypothetical protein
MLDFMGFNNGQIVILWDLTKKDSDLMGFNQEHVV